MTKVQRAQRAPNSAPRAESVLSSPDFDLNNRLMFRIFRTANLMATQCTRHTGDYGLTTQQWLVLGALSRSQVPGGMTVSELSGYLLVSRQNLTGILDRLDLQGLTSRLPDASDGRARRVVLTRTGREMWSRLAVVIAQFNEAALAGFSRKDREAFLRHVDALKNNVMAL